MNKGFIQKMILSLLIPTIACAIQWVFWDQFQPFIWFLFYPAVFFSAQVGGRQGGMTATLLSILLVVFFFVDPIFSLKIEKLNTLYSITVFILMGFFLSNLQENFKREQQKLLESESALRELNIQTERRAEEDLNKALERLDLATTAAQIGIWDWDIQKNHLVWDDQMYQLYGTNKADFPVAYQSWLNGLHPDDRGHSDETSNAAIRGERKYDTEFRVLWPDGSVHWLKANGNVFHDVQGVPLRMVGVNYDITERKRAEDSLRQSKENFAGAFENNPSALAITSRKTGKFILINKTYTTIMGYTPEEIIGNNVGSLSIYADPTERDAILQIISEQGRVINYDLTVRGKNGQIRNILVSMEPAIYDNEDCILSTFIDITDRKQMEQHLRESEKRFATLFRLNPAAVGITHGADYRIADVNDAWSKLTGYQREEALGRTSTELGLAKPKTLSHVRSVLNEQDRVRQSEIQLYTRSGEERQVLLSSEPLELAGEAYFFNTLLDITERKQAEEHLRESEEKYRSLVEASDALVVMLDEDGRIDYLNEKAAQIQGLALKDALGKTLHEVLLKELADLNLERVQHVISKNQSLIVESPVGGGANWYRISMQPIHDANGKVVKVLLSAIDISELKAAQQNLLELNSTLEARVQERTAEVRDLYDNAPNGYHSLDANGTIIMINQTELNWLGYTRDEVVGIKTFQDLITQAGQKIFAENFPLFKKQGWISDLVFEMIRKDGSIFPVLANATAIQDEHGKLIMSRSTLVDITQHKRSEDALRESRDELRFANAALEKASHLKDDFLASMSHELRTPLTGILGLTESLQLNTYGDLNEKQSNALKNIESSGRHLLELINDILDLSKIESSQFYIYPEMLNIEETCRASLTFVKEQAAKKSILLEYQDARDAKSVFADSRRLKQILVNLLSNAVKFTPEKGKVTLAVHTDPEQSQIHFSVTDTGIGIAKEDLGDLFTPFTQVDSRLNRQYEGTGLGLALVLRLTEMHGGHVQVETEPGQGSCFTVSLPWQSQVIPPVDANQPRTELPAKPEPNTRGVILLAEDNASNIETIGEYLQFKGYTLVIALNGAEALLKAKESNPNLILMDIQMPVMDGLETMRRLRADPRFTSTPIIALTALAMTGDRERCMEAGATDYLSKPVKLKELTGKIEELLRS